MLNNFSTFKHFVGDNEVREGELRLVRKTSPWRGRVEVFLSGVWGTISTYGAYTQDAQLVCRQLGYNPYCKCSVIFPGNYFQRWA